MSIERHEKDLGQKKFLDNQGHLSLVSDFLDTISSRPFLLASAVAEAAIGSVATLKGNPKLGLPLVFMSGVTTAHFAIKSLDASRQKNEEVAANPFDFLDAPRLSKLEASRDKVPGSRGFIFLLNDSVEALSKQPWGQSRFDSMLRRLQDSDKKGKGWDISIEKGFPVLTDTDNGEKYTMTKPGDGAPIYP